MNILFDVNDSIVVGNLRRATKKNFGFIFYDTGGGSESESVSQLSPEQQRMLAAAEKQVTPAVRSGQTATPYTGSLTVKPDQRITDMVGQYLDNPDILSSQDLDALNTIIKGEPAFKYDPKTWAKQWSEDYAAPLVGAWSKYTMPAIAESMNITPGSYFSTETTDSIGKSANAFFEQSVAPSLFTTSAMMQQLSADSANQARQLSLGGLQFKSSIPQTQLGTAMAGGDWLTNYKRQNQQNLYGEFQRTAKENSPWLSMALGYGTKPTMDTVVTQNSDPFGQLLQSGATLGAAYMTGGASLAAQGATNAGKIDLTTYGMK